MPITVAIIEDDRSLRQTLVELLDRAPGMRCVASCPSAESAFADLPAMAPDVILLDLRLPGLGGLEFLRQRQRHGIAARVLAFTQHSEDALVLEAVRAGADGFALKRSGLGQLEAGIHAVHRGEGFFPPSIARKLASFVRDTPSAVHVDHAELTEREREVLRSARQGLDNKAIARSLGCAYATVRAHWDHIRAKLAVRTRAEAVAKFFRL